MGTNFTYACFLCNSKQLRNRLKNITMHKFPNDPHMLALWKQVCNLTDRDVVRTLKICRKHFKDSDYIDVVRSSCLKKHAVPSINVPNPLPDVCEISTANGSSSTSITNSINVSIKKENSDSLSDVVENECSASLIEVSEDPLMTNCIKEEVVTTTKLGSDNESDSPLACKKRRMASLNEENNTAAGTSGARLPTTLEGACYQLTEARQKITIQQRKIKKLQQTNSRYLKRIYTLKKKLLLMEEI